MERPTAWLHSGHMRGSGFPFLTCIHSCFETEGSISAMSANLTFRKSKEPKFAICSVHGLHDASSRGCRLLLLIHAGHTACHVPEMLCAPAVVVCCC